jgi:hypothetical protein
MGPDLDQEIALIVKDKPWLHPDLEEGSWWVITSENDGGIIIPHGGGKLGRTTVIDCLARVSYEGGSPVFEVAFGSLEALICPPSSVVRAHRVLIVRDDNPHQAAYQRDQADVDEALRRIQ